MPRVARRPGRGRSVRQACHAWHVRQARGRSVRRACHAWHVRQARGRSVRRACHAWHVFRAGGGACGEHATRGTFARQGAKRAADMPRVAQASQLGTCATKGLAGCACAAGAPNSPRSRAAVPAGPWVVVPCSRVGEVAGSQPLPLFSVYDEAAPRGRFARENSPSMGKYLRQSPGGSPLPGGVESPRSTLARMLASFRTASNRSVSFSCDLPVGRSEPHVAQTSGKEAERAACSHAWHKGACIVEPRVAQRLVRCAVTRGTSARQGGCGVLPRVVHGCQHGSHSKTGSSHGWPTNSTVARRSARPTACS